MATDYSTLDTFIANVKKHGVPRASHFHVIIGGANSGEISSQDVMMMCDSTNLPGYNHMTSEHRRFGEIVEMPYGITYPDINMSFYVDNTLQTKQYFDNWSTKIFNKETRSIGYYRDYTRDMEIFLTDANGNVVYHIKLFEAYPKSIGDFQVDYSNHDILRIPVAMKYKWTQVVFSTKTGEPNKNSQLTSQDALNNYKSTTTNYSSEVTDEPYLAYTEGATGASVINGNDMTLQEVGTQFTQRIPSSGVGLSTAILASSLPVGLSTDTRSISNNISAMGSNITGMAENQSNPGQYIAGLASGASGVASSVVTMAGRLGTIGATVNGMIQSASALEATANRLSSISNFNDALNVVSSLGSNLAATGGYISQVSNTLNGITGATASVMDAFNFFGSEISTGGSDLSTSVGFYD